GILGRETLERREQEGLARQGRDPRQPRLGNALRAGRTLIRLLALLDIGRGPDGVKGPVQAQPRIDIARELIGLGDDRLERRSNEGIAMRLAAGQRTRVTAQEWQVRSKFLTKGHFWILSLEAKFAPSLAAAPVCCNPGRKVRTPLAALAPRYDARLEQRTGHLVSPTRAGLAAQQTLPRSV